MKFEVGQVVVISNPSTKYTQQFKGERVVVETIREGDTFPYGVIFRSGKTLSFAEAELSPLGPQGGGNDPVNHPSHYTWLPNGIEVIHITQLFNFNLGNALKYIMRAGHKGDAAEDLRKAAKYIEFELKRMESH